MTEKFRRLRRAAALFALPTLLLAACESSTGPDGGDATEAAVVVNSSERSITVIPVDDPTASFTIGVSPEGSPVSVAARGEIAVVPLGTYPFAAVVNLSTRTVQTVALPAGSGATGAAFLNDSVALVANPNLNSVSPVYVRRATPVAGDPIPVGGYPHEIVSAGGRAYVLNAHLERFVPTRPGSVTVIDGSLRAVSTIDLGGLNPGGAAVGPDGRLYVVNSGRYGANNGSLSVVDPAAGRELSHHPGFGDFPSGIAAARDRVLVGLYGTGILEWNPASQAFTRGLDNPLRPGAVPPVSDFGFDSEGRLFVLTPGTCDAAGTAYRLTAAGAVEFERATGICPFGLAFASLPER